MIEAILYRGLVHYYQGDHQTTQTLYDEAYQRSVKLLEKISENPDVVIFVRESQAQIEHAMGILALEQGELEKAIELQQKALRFAWKTHQELSRYSYLFPMCIEALAVAAFHQGDEPQAAMLYGAAIVLCEQSIGDPSVPAEKKSNRHANDAPLKARMNDPAFAQTYERGRALTLEEAIALGLEQGHD